MCKLLSRFWSWCCAKRFTEMQDKISREVNEEVQAHRQLAREVTATSEIARHKTNEVRRSAKRLMLRLERERRSDGDHHVSG